MSLDADSMDMRITVYLPSGLVEAGIISYSVDGPIITLDKGDIIRDSDPQGDLSFTFQNQTEKLQILSDEKIWFRSTSTMRNYSTTEISKAEMYPKSTGGWITGLSETGDEALLITHPIVNHDKYLLLILDLANQDILNVQLVNPYERMVLFMQTDMDEYWKLYGGSDVEIRKSLLDGLLNSQPPKWNELAALAGSVNVPNLKIGKTMRDTMDQLVPESFPDNVREELMAFLSLVTKTTIPDEDPLDISVKYRPTPLIHNLFFHHIQCLIEGDATPEYVKVFTMADRGLLPIAIEPSTTAIENNPWDNAWYQLTSMFRDRRSRIVPIVKELNQNQEIITGIPISKEQATRSKKIWIDRFAMILNALQIRGHVQNQSIGLRTMIYLGGAHRWPHKHLSWTARLGSHTEKPPYIQVMVMPPSAAERIKRLRTNISEISWSVSNINYDLFIDSKQKWKANTTRILKSLEGNRSLKQLEREFHANPTRKIHTPSFDESKVLGLITWSMYVSLLELGDYSKFLNITTDRFREILTNLRDNNILRLQYYLPIAGLASICFVCNGPSQKIRSLSRALLKHAPSTTGMITENGERCYIISRMPEESVYDIATQLPEKAKEIDMEVKVFKANAYAAYTHNLYQRLLRDDGTWDDDISGLLSQIHT